MNKQLNDLKIDNIEPKNGLKHPPVYNSILPQHEFSMLIVAPKGSGKTNFICNLLLKHYKKYFHRVLVCSPSIDSDEKWDVVKKTRDIIRENVKLQKILADQTVQRKLPQVVHKSGKNVEDKEPKFDGKIPEKDFFSDMNLIPEYTSEQTDVVKRLRDKGYDEKAKMIADRLLIIMDDQAGLFKGGNTNNPIVNYVIKHRHYSSSCIIVTQAYKAVPRTIRVNCNALILFEIPNLKELEGIYEENPESMTQQEWYQTYKYATQDPYSFMYINNKLPKGERIFKNFTDRLQVREMDKFQLAVPPQFAAKSAKGNGGSKRKHPQSDDEEQ